MNLMRGQGIFCVEGHTTSHMQTAHVGALAALSKNSITESQNIQGLFFFLGIREDEDYAGLNKCSSFGITSGKCKGAEALLMKTQAPSV